MDNRAFLETLLAILSNPNRKAAFLDLCDFYSSGADDQREFIRRNYPFGEDWNTPHILDCEEHHNSSGKHCEWYSTLPGEMPGEFPASRRIRCALILLSIRGGGGDYRDDHLFLMLIYYAAKEVGMDARALFDEVAALSGQEPVGENYSTMQREQMGHWLHGYSSNEITVSLEDMGFTPMKTPKGTRFVEIDI